MKEILLTFFIFFSVYNYSQNTNSIKIYYDFKDENPDLLKSEKEEGVLVINFQDYILQGNKDYAEFYVVNDLKFENKIKFLTEQKSPVKRRRVSYFYNGKYNVDLKNRKSYAELDLANKEYLVMDSLNLIDWKVERKEKKILNFLVRRATYSDDDKFVEAWYAQKLPFKIGPLNYMDLPGAILELSVVIKGDKKPIYHLVAKDVILSSEKDYSLPSDREIIDQNEFDIIYNKYLKEQEEYKNQGVNTSD